MEKFKPIQSPKVEFCGIDELLEGVIFGIHKQREEQIITDLAKQGIKFDTKEDLLYYLEKHAEVVMIEGTTIKVLRIDGVDCLKWDDKVQLEYKNGTIKFTSGL